VILCTCGQQYNVVQRFCAKRSTGSECREFVFTSAGPIPENHFLGVQRLAGRWTRMEKFKILELAAAGLAPASACHSAPVLKTGVFAFHHAAIFGKPGVGVEPIAQVLAAPVPNPSGLALLAQIVRPGPESNRRWSPAKRLPCHLATGPHFESPEHQRLTLLFVGTRVASTTNLQIFRLEC
jgi:hypothetical protein